jgi:hypothetical protein
MLSTILLSFAAIGEAISGALYVPIPAFKELLGDRWEEENDTITW